MQFIRKDHNINTQITIYKTKSNNNTNNNNSTTNETKLINIKPNRNRETHIKILTRLR